MPGISFICDSTGGGLRRDPAVIRGALDSLCHDERYGRHDWMYERGKSTYMRFLLSHPAFTIQEPLRHPEELLASELRNYAPVKFSAILKGVLAEAIYPKEWVLLWIWAAALAVGLAVGLRLWTFNPAVVIALLLIVLAYPHAALQWHGDPNEIGRHGLQAGMHLLLGIWLLLIFAADMLVNHNRKSRVVANDASSKRPARNRS